MDSAAGKRESGFGHRLTTKQRQRVATEPRRNAVIVRPPTRKPPAPRGTAAAAPRKRTPKPAAESLPAMPGTPRKKATIAGPRRKKPERQTTTVAELDRMQQVIMASLEDDKAEEVVAIDLAGRASFADRMIVATGLADRQISAMAMHLNEKLVEAGFKKTRAEGAGGSDWVLIDAGDIIVHLFKPESRTLYALEKMWSAELDETPDEAEPEA
jgi:ribosome-associated protein